MRIDLHAHTTASDGTDTPEQLVHQAAMAQLDVVAITDHDTWDGWDAAASAAREVGVAVVRGAELTCVRGSVTVHLLAYLFDPTHLALKDGVSMARQTRWGRVEQMVESLSSVVPLTVDDVRQHVPDGAMAGRPHVADALVALGHVRDRSQAFAELIGDDSPHYRPHRAMDPRDACTWVTQAGGVAVLAHPRARTRGSLPSDDVIEELVAAGLWGLERDHPEHDASARAQVDVLARRYGLAATGASDYHGAGKPQGLGACVTDPDVWDELRRRATGVSVVG